MHELPLVFFTVLGQMGAGAVFISALYSLTSRVQNTVKIERINIAALVVMAVAMGIASLHLGHPLRALNVIFGIGRSPMSNEIFTFGILFGITFVSVLLAYFTQPNKGSKLALVKTLANRINTIPRINTIIALLLIIVSLFFVWTIVATYMIPTVQNWDTGYTALQMYTAMLILGGILAATFGLRRAGLALFIIGALIVLATKLPYIRFLSQHTLELVQAQYYWWLLQCGLLILSVFIALRNSRKSCRSTPVYAIALLLALVAELCGRIAFYNLWAIPM
ncbi:DmsC/YnfH family molybdoenzyme membrane anchor subunit [Orbus sturtevantii]|uniref:dimethyl sulfoxide reductase anchor subunit family protein n=1 Tax=Orbus sturtevantii TaxID=3074109 RepID=UPI00370D6382